MRLLNVTRSRRADEISDLRQSVVSHRQDVVYIERAGLTLSRQLAFISLFIRLVPDQATN